MTDTAAPDTELVSPELARIVPEGKDALDDLTCGELGHIGRKLRFDPYTAVKDPTTGLRWEALSLVAWVWAKRTDPTAKVEQYLAMRGGDVAQLLGMTDDDADDVDPLDPEDELAANPTDCAGESPSPAPGASTPTP